jgi:hypothetical protein
MPRDRQHYHVYVIELSPRAWDVAGFRRANPVYLFNRPLVYVGMTGLDPDIRFDRHKAGVQSNRFAREFGLRLRPDLYEMYNPMVYEVARKMEVDLAKALRAQGFGVWQA